jgi:formylmethanofuran--tetrahydromethanopterin N-formyltransferase
MEKAKITRGSYAEAFEGICCRLIVTADDKETLEKAAYDATALPSVVIGRTEGGIEKLLSKEETPDKRRGAILQFWGAINSDFAASLKKFETELSYRIRQGILVKPFTAIFDAGVPNAVGKIDMMKSVGHCGDANEWTENRYGREVITVPIMVPDFFIERYVSYGRGVMGANFWIMCKTKKTLKKVGKEALEAVHKIEGVITPFDVCSAGSKPETKFPWIGPTTNDPYCPSLKKKLGKKSKVPKIVNYIPEIVIDGVSEDAVKKAMKAGIDAVLHVKGVVSVTTGPAEVLISAGSYGGKLGKYKISLRDLFH